MEPLLEGLLRSLGGSEANFLEVCFGRLPSGNFHTKATSKKSRPPSGNFRPNPPELPRSPSRSFSSHETGWKIVLPLAMSKDSIHVLIQDKRFRVCAETFLEFCFGTLKYLRDCLLTPPTSATSLCRTKDRTRKKQPELTTNKTVTELTKQELLLWEHFGTIMNGS